MLLQEHLISTITKSSIKPLIMGIVNVTPDSFSDGGLSFDCEQAVALALKHIEQGADIIDIGGESSRPGSDEVCFNDEHDRVIPVIIALRKKTAIPISIDTRKAKIAESAIEAGANIVNDISSFSYDSDMIHLIKNHPNVCYVLMHMQGKPSTMQQNPIYRNVVDEVYDFIQEKIETCISIGIDYNQLIIDPGIGFGKSVEHNLSLIANLDRFNDFDLPILIGTSRKSFINCISTSNTDNRLAGSLASSFYNRHIVDIIRVHDVFAHKQFNDVTQAIGLYKEL